MGLIATVCEPRDGQSTSKFVAHWVSERDRVDTMQRRNGAASLLARAGLRALLAQQTGRTDWQFKGSALGKPFVVHPSGAAGPAISLSHTLGVIALAMAGDGVLGVDVEWHRPRDFAALAAQAFGVGEQAEVAVGGADAFYRIWTLREAVAKATGEGLALAGNGRDLLVAGSPESRPRTGHGGRAWHLEHKRIAPECSLALAHADTTDDPWTVQWVTLVGLACPLD